LMEWKRQVEVFWSFIGEQQQNHQIARE